ncbi:MAG: hypothetical protein IME99_05315 [Proteobacteria bacterium]|nr:hypothetical protein [Pseudomonadota bacterium]
MEHQKRTSTGVKRQLLGTVLLCIALLNSMLALKAGARLDPFNLALLATGGVLLASGLLAKRWARGKREQGRPT